MAYYVGTVIAPIVVSVARTTKVGGTQNAGAGSPAPTTGQLFPRGKN
jgi:hypothetical protein